MNYPYPILPPGGKVTIPPNRDKKGSKTIKVTEYKGFKKIFINKIVFKILVSVSFAKL